MTQREMRLPGGLSESYTVLTVDDGMLKVSATIQAESAAGKRRLAAAYLDYRAGGSATETQLQR